MGIGNMGLLSNTTIKDFFKCFKGSWLTSLSPFIPSVISPTQDLEIQVLQLVLLA